MKIALDVKSELNQTQMLKIQQIVDDCIAYIDSKKVGYVQANFFKGGVTTINNYETKK
jgi:hypothetical protein